MHNMKRKVISSLMAVMMASVTISGNYPSVSAYANRTTDTVVTKDATQVDASGNEYGLVSQTQGNILHAWDWKFKDVTANMKAIAESGYSNVQVSPCQTIRVDVSQNSDWWQFYQPTDFAFGNSFGSKEEFKAMCDEADKYGVHIIVDIVSNHLAGGDTSLDGKVADKWKSNTKDYFHKYGEDYMANSDDDRERMVLGTIGMPDLNTEHAEVQNAVKNYLGELLDMGADGFRFDAAKHIGTPSDSGNAKSNYWEVISKYVKEKDPNALLYGEILNGIPMSIDYYTPYIKVTESQKGWDMKDLIKGTSVSQKLAFDYTRTTKASNLITWVESHDTYCNANQETGTEGTSNYMSNQDIKLAWSLVAARADAQSLFFARPAGIVGEGSGKDRKVTVQGSVGINTNDSTWKSAEVAAVNKFKNAMTGEGEKCSTSGSVTTIVRGNKGVVVTNFGGDSNFNVSGLSGLKDGTYKDASGQNGEFTVSGGNVSGNIKGKTFVVLYDENATAKPTEAPTEAPADGPTNEPTEAPTDEPTNEPTEAPTGIGVSASQENGTSFDTETLDVKLSVWGASEGTYSIDNGPEQTFKDGDTIKVGEGKIADSDVTLVVKAKADNATAYKYTYKKTFNKEKAAKEQSGTLTKSAVKVLGEMAAIVKDAVQTNADAVSDGIYATNPDKKVGKEAKITIDGSFSDWSDDMLIAQGAAFDTATAFKGMHENRVMDSYALYGAWDNDNLYIGFQMVNVYDDAVKDLGLDMAGGPLAENGKMGDTPMIIAINTGKGNKMTGNLSDGTGIWGNKVEFETRVDHLLYFHANNTLTPGLFTAGEDGLTNYESLCQNFDDLGIELKIIDDCLSSTIMGVKDNKGDVKASYSTSSDWVDFKQTTHDTKYDTFYEMCIPLKALGIDKSYLEENGIGVMQLITRGESAMDCIPHDPAMLDNALEDYGGATDNTSREKDDLDIITVPLAAVGSTKAIGNGGGGSSTITTTPTPKPSDDANPTPTATATSDANTTEAPTPTATGNGNATGEVGMSVNFGANVSSPQYHSADLNLKAIGYEGKAPYTYQFLVDNAVVQDASATDTYTWKPSVGQHTISVVMTDADGKTVTSTKNYNVVLDANAPTVVPTDVPTAVPTDVPTAVPTNVPTPTPALKVSKLEADSISPQMLGKSIKLKASATGGKKSYTYTFKAKLKSTGATTTIAKNTKKTTVTWKPKKAGTYTVTVTVKDANKKTASKSITYVISKKQLSFSKVSTSTKTGKVKKPVKLSIKAIAGKGKLKYKFAYKLGKKKGTIKKYSTKKTVTWKPKKAGTYTLYYVIKDGSGTEVRRQVKFKVKK